MPERRQPLKNIGKIGANKSIDTSMILVTMRICIHCLFPIPVPSKTNSKPIHPKDYVVYGDYSSLMNQWLNPFRSWSRFSTNLVSSPVMVFRLCSTLPPLYFADKTPVVVILGPLLHPQIAQQITALVEHNTRTGLSHLRHLTSFS